MCLPRLTLRLAFRTCFCKAWPTCQLVHVLQVETCKSTCELHRRSALSTRPTWPPRMDRQHGFHHRVPSSLLTRAFSTLPTAAWVKIRWSKLFTSVLGPFDLPTDQSRTATLHLVHPFQHERFATVVVAPFLIDNFEHSHFHHVLISCFRPAINNFGSIHVPSTHHSFSSSVGQPPSSGTRPAKCSSPTLIAPSEII